MEFKARKIQVPDNNPFQNDKLEIRQHVENLSSLLKNLSSPIVFSINAPWGHGKTTFLEMLKANLKNDGNRTLFFSAWETDFAVDPLLAFLGEINQELNSLIDGDSEKNKSWQKAKKAGIHIIKKGIPALIKVGTAGVIDAEKIIEDEASKFAESLTKDIIDEYSKDKEAINHFKENIKKLFKDSDSNKSKLYIFIDELDRCRPTYAIEFLERIKHLLDIDGLVFILAMDKVQLSHSVKGVYGNEFEAIGYLRRFIDIEYFLPESNLDGFIDHLYQIFGFDEFFERRKEYHAFQYDVQHLNGVFKLIASSKKMSLREIEQLFAKINLVLHATGENVHLYPALFSNFRLGNCI